MRRVSTSVLFGVAVTPSGETGAVALWFMLQGGWLPVRFFSIALEGQVRSMDSRLRDLVATLHPDRLAFRERQEHLAILARWFYSSWRDGEWVRFDSIDKLPYRKLIGSISRTADRLA
jgi:hypothetical protein